MSIKNISIEKKTYLPYKEIAIGVILLQYIINNYLGFRQYKRLKKNLPIPSELSDLEIDKEKYKKSQEYSKTKLKFGFLANFIKTTVEILFLYFNFYAYTWELSKRQVEKLKMNSKNEYYVLIIYVIISSFIDKITEIPFSYYETFNIEEEYEFNKTTHSTFIKDIIKEYILEIILGPLIYSFLIFGINYGGKYFYITAELIMIIIQLSALWIYPNVIAPLFNKFSELEEGELKKEINSLAKSVDFPLTKIFVVDQSIRSSHSNAYLFGFGNNKRIVLFDTLKERLTVEEIKSVLGHEIGHWKYSHTLKTGLISIIHIFILFYLFGYFMDNEGLFISFGFNDMSIFIGISLFLLLFSPFEVLFNIALNIFTRHFEFQADSFSFELGYGDKLIHSLKVLSEKNLSNMDPDPLYSFIKHSHPTLIERVKAINELKKNKKNK